MQKGFNPKNEKRSTLLKLCLEKGISLDTQLKIIEPMRGKTDAEKEKIAEQLILEVQNSTSSGHRP